MPKRVTVVPYDPQWKEDFETIRRYLLPEIGRIVTGIEHVGSTSVEGLSAKPIIDLDVVMKDYTVFPELIERLASLGYLYEGDLGIPQREAFDYRGSTELPGHHLYVCPAASDELRRHLSFRDYLRRDRDVMLQYSRIKEEGAKLYPDDIDAYIRHKSPFIESIYKKLGLPIPGRP